MLQVHEGLVQETVRAPIHARVVDVAAITALPPRVENALCVTFREGHLLLAHFVLPL